MKSPRLLALLLLLAGHLACQKPALIATTSSQTSGATARFHFFTRVQNPPLKFSNVNETLAIDGYPTNHRYPKYPPGVFECTHLLLQFDSDEFALWNVNAHTLSASIEGYLAPMTAYSSILVQRGPPNSPEKILDLDPDAGQFKTLFTSEAGESLSPVGLWNDPLYFFINRPQDRYFFRDLLQIKSADLSTSRSPVDIQD